MDAHRKIIHIDMDAFFAAIEQLDNPSLRKKPIAVGYDGPRGVVATCSYEARKFGVRSAMPSFKAKQLCGHLIFVYPRFKRYREISNAIRNIFEEYSDKIEPLSLDEAYIDVTKNKIAEPSAIKVARQIKSRIFENTGLTASAGVSVNKFLAKVASDLHKPDGLSVILPEDVQRFIDHLPVEKFYGIGKATAERMKSFGILSGYDLRQKSELDLVNKFGKVGRYFYQVVRGEDSREVEPTRIRKSISVERTYENDLSESDLVFSKLEMLVEMLVESLQKRNIKGRTIHLKLRFLDFETLSKSKSIQHFSNDYKLLHSTIFELFEMLEWSGKPIRLLGAGMSNLDTELRAKQIEFEF